MGTKGETDIRTIRDTGVKIVGSFGRINGEGFKEKS